MFAEVLCRGNVCLCVFVQAAKYIIVVGTMQLSLLYVVGYDREVSVRDYGFSSQSYCSSL